MDARVSALMNPVGSEGVFCMYVPDMRVHAIHYEAITANKPARVVGRTKRINVPDLLAQFRLGRCSDAQIYRRFHLHIIQVTRAHCVLRSARAHSKFKMF